MEYQDAIKKMEKGITKLQKKLDEAKLLFCKLNDAPVVTLNDAITV